MSEISPDILNERFALGDQLQFQAGPGGFPIAMVRNAHATASVCLYGGHVLSYRPTDQDEVLWVSSQSLYRHGNAIRGGIPICWPWFADHPSDPGKPAHGFVRNAMWKVLDTKMTDHGQTQIRLTVSDQEETRTIWPHRFQLTVAVTVGPQLSVDLITHNQGDQPMVCGGALHTYLGVANIDDITIGGLEATTYIDKVDDFKQKPQVGPVRITRLTDSIYINTTADCVIEDPTKRRRIRIAKSGSRSTVIWNPWSDKASTMSDFGNEEYQSMVCVESANAAEDLATVDMGQTHCLGTRISTERL